MAILLYDGDCGFCERSVAILRRLAGPALYAVAWQRADLAPLRVSPTQLRTEVVLVDGDQRFAGAVAFAVALRSAGGAPALIGWLIGRPGLRSVAAVCYRVIARHRHRLPGGSAVCRIR